MKDHDVKENFQTIHYAVKTHSVIPVVLATRCNLPENRIQTVIKFTRLLAMQTC